MASQLMESESATMGNYLEFLDSKQVAATPSGFDTVATDLNGSLFEWQNDITRWSLRVGRSAIFADCGLGKTLMQLEWARKVHQKTNQSVLVFCPLAVAKQTAREAAKFSIDAAITVCRSQADVQPGINVANYERLQKFDCQSFAGVVLDESSILKSLTSKTRQRLTESFLETPYKLCCTATPAPNDLMELGNHAEFLGVMKRSEMLAMFFVHDSNNTAKWRLKGHAVNQFWAWVSTWAVSLSSPSDLGFDNGDFDLPPVTITKHLVADSDSTPEPGILFAKGGISATSINREKRRTTQARAAALAGIVNASEESWVVWCNINTEADALKKLIPGSVEVRGSMTADVKEQRLESFSAGKTEVIITKPSIAGHGLNWQHCRNQAFIGLSYSFEEFYQAMRRLWRFGQKRSVNVHVFETESEAAVSRIVWDKDERHRAMKSEMAELMRDDQLRSIYGGEKSKPNAGKLEVSKGESWNLWRGDCVDAIAKIADERIHYSIFSPPFSSLYTYSDDPADMGNSSTYEEFWKHFSFLIPELYRVIMPGRLCSIHCMNLPTTIQHNGVIGIDDFRGDIIRAFKAAGWIFHSEVCIWKDPLIAATRTKAIGLMHKQVCKDSAMCRQGIPDYLVTMRKPGENAERISRKRGFEDYIGEKTDTPDARKRDNPKENKFSHHVWRRYASPIWTDINQTRVLKYTIARAEKDERHICPLQLDVIERCIELWTNSGDVVFSPFAGIGSEGHVSIERERQFIGVELKESYAKIAERNLQSAEEKAKQGKLF